MSVYRYPPAITGAPVPYYAHPSQEIGEAVVGIVEAMARRGYRLHLGRDRAGRWARFGPCRPARSNNRCRAATWDAAIREAAMWAAMPGVIAERVVR
jgi:hypothetical protein